ncbi:hypothetical protein DY000_02020580 [Brassica cretica]|uniref:Uncharacterized protein n=1 Tax=Brassica cretica TaxID=69181 RepID=A0ABQ7E9Q3_BRACR|nr:hypothetical protein DY000_02020580 [Brassica cretica]
MEVFHIRKYGRFSLSAICLFFELEAVPGTDTGVPDTRAPELLGELHGFSIGVHEILYSYYIAPLANKDEFYHPRSRDGAPLVEEPSRGVRGSHPFGDGWNSRYVFVKIQEPVGYPTSWRTVDVSRPVSFAGEAVAKLIMGIPWRFLWVTFLVSREALRHSSVWGNVTRSPVSVVYDEYQKVKARKRCLSYTPPPRLAWGALSAEGAGIFQIPSNHVYSQSVGNFTIWKVRGCYNHPFIVWGIVRRGSNTPSGFSTSFLLELIGFSSDLWVLALLVEIFCPDVMDDPTSRCVPLLWRGQGVVGDLGFLGLEDLSPEWFFKGKMRYLILLLGTPYLAGVFGVPRYLTRCGDDTCGSSPSPSWGMMLLWAEFAGAYEFSADPRP